MKTAISISDDLFRQAEAAARKLKISRSQLYAAAISEYLDRRENRRITARLNEIYAEGSAKLDVGLNAAQLQSIEREHW